MVSTGGMRVFFPCVALPRHNSLSKMLLVIVSDSVGPVSRSVACRLLVCLSARWLVSVVIVLCGSSGGLLALASLAFRGSSAGVLLAGSLARRFVSWQCLREVRSRSAKTYTDE